MIINNNNNCNVAWCLALTQEYGLSVLKAMFELSCRTNRKLEPNVW
jgi:hypothetical protein